MRVYRNTTVEHYFEEEYDYQGYDDFSNPGIGEECILIFYILPLAESILRIEYIDYLRRSLELLISSNKNSNFYFLEIPRIKFAFSIEEIINENEAIYSLNKAVDSHKNVTLIPVEFHVSSSVNWSDINLRGYSRYKDIFRGDLRYTLTKNFRDLENYLHRSVKKKVLVLDCDNTLWKGVIGEDGIDGISHGEDLEGLAYNLSQGFMKSLKNTGVLLCLASKNYESDVWPHFEGNSFVLGAEDITSRRINWSSKDKSIIDLAKELSLGLDSFMFYDDNPLEREIVSSILPMVEVLSFKENPQKRFETLISELRRCCFSFNILDEDKSRVKEYQLKFAREEVIKNGNTIEHIIESLGIELSVVEPRENIARVVELTNKTNQFNLTTKRYSLIQMTKFLEKGEVYPFRVKDKFSDMGIVGLVMIEKSGNQHYVLDNFLMSCRVLGRGIENKMWQCVVEKLPPGSVVTARYIESARNGLVKDLLDTLSFKKLSDHYEYRK